MPATLEIRFAGESLILLGDRAIYWPVEKTLLLADVHLGKDASFRAAGLSVPAGSSVKDLSRIQTLLRLTSATRLIVLGDLVHNRFSHQPELAEAFSNWRLAHAELEILLVRGNHDRHAGPPPVEWRITQIPHTLEMGPFTLSHTSPCTDKPCICGHIHPTVAIPDFDGSLVTAPCFVMDPSVLILPAFGSFTGGHKMRPEFGRSIYAVLGTSVVRLPSPSIPQSI